MRAPCFRPSSLTVREHQDGHTIHHLPSVKYTVAQGAVIPRKFGWYACLKLYAHKDFVAVGKVSLPAAWWTSFLTPKLFSSSVCFLSQQGRYHRFEVILRWISESIIRRRETCRKWIDYNARVCPRRIAQKLVIKNVILEDSPIIVRTAQQPVESCGPELFPSENTIVKNKTRRGQLSKSRAVLGAATA